MAHGLSRSKGRALLEAARVDNVEKIDELIKEGPEGLVDYVEDGWSPLKRACDSGRLLAVKHLLRHGADPKLDPGAVRSPLHCAAGIAHRDICEALLNAGADPNTRGAGTEETPLMAACKLGAAIVVEALVTHGADPNAMDTEGNTAMHWCLIRGRPEPIHTLLAYKANPKNRNKDGKSCHDLASELGLPESVQHLLHVRVVIIF